MGPQTTRLRKKHRVERVLGPSNRDGLTIANFIKSDIVVSRRILQFRRFDTIVNLERLLKTVDDFFIEARYFHRRDLTPCACFM